METNDSEKFIEELFEIYNYAITKPLYKNHPQTREYIEATIERKNEIIKSLRKIKNIKENIYSEPVIECINQYIKTEMDYYTPGIRGIGRITTSPPRFGGYFAKFLIRLTQKEINIIDEVISNIVQGGYKNHLMFELLHKERILLKPKGFSYNSLYEKWIPLIYGTNMTFNASEPVQEILNDSRVNSGIYFFYRISEETNFPKKFLNTKKLFGKGWLQTIIQYYVDAGFILRYTELFAD